VSGAAPAPYGPHAAAAAADSVRRRVGGAGAAPAAALILGSGLGGIAERIEGAVRVPFAEIPGFPSATVAGHRGELIAGTLAGRPVLALAGRFHLYEGHPAALAALPVRVLHALGARTLFVSNAAGGVRRTFRAGDLMIIADHLNLMGQNPLVGAAEEAEPRFPDMSEPYSRALTTRLRAVALGAGISLQEGVYAGLLGPTYETPAEVRMLDRLGADAVGMSTVPEVIVARALGMQVAGVSCITNLAAGISPDRLSHAEVLETTRRVAASFEQLVIEFVRSLPVGEAAA
jgi:purine-nucleoside phosphorylase